MFTRERPGFGYQVLFLFVVHAYRLSCSVYTFTEDLQQPTRRRRVPTYFTTGRYYMTISQNICTFTKKAPNKNKIAATLRQVCVTSKNTKCHHIFLNIY